MENRKPIKVVLQPRKEKTVFDKYKEDFISGVDRGFDIVETVTRRFNETLDLIGKKMRKG